MSFEKTMQAVQERYLKQPHTNDPTTGQERLRDVLTVRDLINIRKRLGLSQKQMGDKLGLSMRSIQDIESGKTKFRLLHSLALQQVVWIELKGAYDASE